MILRLSLIVSSFAFFSCNLKKDKFQADNVSSETLQFVDKTIDDVIASGISNHFKVTINTESLSTLSKNPGAFLELQDYIIQKIERSDSELGKNFQLGISLNLTKDISQINEAVEQLLAEKKKVDDITNNVDYATAQVNPQNENKLFAKDLGKLGIGISENRQSKDLFVDNNFTLSNCQKTLDENDRRSTIHSLSVIVDQTQFKNSIRRQLVKCFQLAKTKKYAVNLVITPKL